MAMTMEWSVLERLLLAQAVNKYGEDNWFQVARTLRQHPLTQSKTDLFNQKNCSLQYFLMVDELDKESRRTPKTAESLVAQEMPNAHKLARHLYTQRVAEVRKSMEEDEAKIMQLISEIDDIKAGLWDSKLADEAAAANSAATVAAAAASASANTPVDTPMTDDDRTRSATASPIVPKIEQQDTPIASATPAVSVLAAASATPDAPSSTSPEDASAPILPSSASAEPTETSATASPTIKREKSPSDFDSSATPMDIDAKSVPQDIEADNEREIDEKDTSASLSATPATPVAAAAKVSATDEDMPTPTHKRTMTDDHMTDDEHQENAKRPRIDHDDKDTMATPTAPLVPEGDEQERPESEQAEGMDDHTATSTPAAHVAPGGSPPASRHATPAEPSPATSASSPDHGTDKLGLLLDNEGAESGSESATPTTTAAATPASTTAAAGTSSTPSSIPTDKRSSSTSSTSKHAATKDDQRQKSWLKNINLLWREIANHKNGAMFMNPIKVSQAPHYYQVIKHPLDLKTIKNRIRDNHIRTTVEFERDVVLMLVNSLMYNQEDTETHQLALEMLQDVNEQIKAFKTAEGSSAPTPKETRRKSVAE
ncbi:hypothetical protein BC940DRAFT_370947 [Gongronella butleri]|nr:hypothetical protein BC940DRAFT_370947 [Gongronella butleri]